MTEFNEEDLRFVASRYGKERFDTKKAIARFNEAAASEAGRRRRWWTTAAAAAAVLCGDGRDSHYVSLQCHTDAALADSGVCHGNRTVSVVRVCQEA